MRIQPAEFTVESVAGMLAGLKTQSRRHAKSDKGKPSPLLKLEPGDKIWVREPILWHPGQPPAVYGARQPHFEAGKWPQPIGDYQAVDMTRRPDDWAPRGDRTTGRYMPKWAGRLILTVRDIRVEPLRSIREEDAVAEGMINAFRVNGWTLRETPLNSTDYFAPYGLFEQGRAIALHAPQALRRGDPVRAYAALWDELHKASGRRFQDNPDVVVLDFAEGIECGCVLDLEAALEARGDG